MPACRQHVVANHAAMSPNNMVTKGSRQRQVLQLNFEGTSLATALLIQILVFRLLRKTTNEVAAVLI